MNIIKFLKYAVGIKNESKNLYFNRKIKKSSNPAIAFFQSSSRNQKKVWKKVIRGANKMQREIMYR